MRYSGNLFLVPMLCASGGMLSRSTNLDNRFGSSKPAGEGNTALARLASRNSRRVIGRGCGKKAPQAKGPAPQVRKQLIFGVAQALSPPCPNYVRPFSAPSANRLAQESARPYNFSRRLIQNQLAHARRTFEIEHAV